MHGTPGIKPAIYTEGTQENIEAESLRSGISHVILELRQLSGFSIGSAVVAGIIRTTGPSWYHHVGLVAGMLAFVVSLFASWRWASSRPIENELVALKQRLVVRIVARNISGVLLCGGVVMVSLGFALRSS